jgi:predicted nuclease of predicted toxin-antitoxin system
MTDDDILRKAFAENWVLITNDKDLGDKVYRDGHPHRGVVSLRLQDEWVASKISTLKRLIEDYADQLADRFVVVTETRVRFARTTWVSFVSRGRDV